MTTPTISAVSGTVSTGQILTITGANMVDHDTTNWDTALNESKASFEGASFDADGWVADIGTQDTAQKLFGSKALRNSYSGAHSGPDGHVGRFYSLNFTKTAPFWVRCYYRADTTTIGDGSWPDTYCKVFSFYGSGGVNSVFLDWLCTGSTPTQLNVIDDANHATSSFTLVEQRWHCIEIKFPSSGSLNCQVYFDDTQIYNANVSAAPTTASDQLEMDTNRGNTPAGFGMRTWWDGMVVSSSRVGLASKVEIGNNATYASATKVYQLPEALSNTSSEVRCNLTGLGAGPYYMWVTNNKGERSDTFSLSASFTGARSAYMRL